MGSHNAWTMSVQLASQLASCKSQQFYILQEYNSLQIICLAASCKSIGDWQVGSLQRQVAFFPLLFISDEIQW